MVRGDDDTVEVGADARERSAATAVPSSSGLSSAELLARLRDADFNARYGVLSEIGAGGMGEVRLVEDRRVGRAVAMKVVRRDLPGTDTTNLRFLREAQVQGRLEHPSIVPVYDMGVAPDGSPFFTMKRVRGQSLHDTLVQLRLRDATTAAKYTQRRLLAAFSSICLAVHYAHTRKVLHRDLKPDNIMLGDFGEVYVLDWGVAKDEASTEPASAHDHDSYPAATRVGAIVGTAGYIAPELCDGTGKPSVQSDVYGLGTILFEILTLERLHTGETPDQVFAATVAGVDVEARMEGTQVSPELARACARALAADPAARYRTAEELGERIERYLDGDRDLERRRLLAAEHAELAERALDGDMSEAARAEAMEQAGRALALDPTHRGAAATVARLLMTPPDVMPREIVAELEEIDRKTLRPAGYFSAAAYAGWLVLLPVFLWAGVREVAELGVMLIAAAIASLLGLVNGRRSSVRSIAGFYAPLIISSVAIAATARILGPFAFVPVLAVVNGLTPLLIRPYAQTRWWITVAIGWLAMMIPAVIEWTGLLPPSYTFQDGALVVAPRMLELSPGPLWSMFLLVSITTLFPPGLVIARVGKELLDAQRRLALQTWHLRRLLPEPTSASEERAGSS